MHFFLDHVFVDVFVSYTIYAIRYKLYSRLVVGVGHFTENALECYGMGRRSSNFVDGRVILSTPLPEQNILWCISKAGMTISWVVLSPVLFSFIRSLVSSSMRSSQVIMSSIFSLRALRSVSFGLIPRKNPMLASIWESYFLILRNAELLRSVSKMPLLPLAKDPYFSCEID